MITPMENGPGAKKLLTLELDFVENENNPRKYLVPDKRGVLSNISGRKGHRQSCQIAIYASAKFQRIFISNLGIRTDEGKIISDRAGTVHGRASYRVLMIRRQIGSQDTPNGSREQMQAAASFSDFSL